MGYSLNKSLSKLRALSALLWWPWVYIVGYRNITEPWLIMEAPTDRLWELEFNGLPEFMKIRRRIKSNGGLLNDIVSEVIVDVHDLHTVCCEDRFLAFSQMPPFTITFPEEFFGQSNDDNVEGFLAVLRLCLLRSHSGTNINERNINTSQDDPSAKPAAPHGFDHTKGYDLIYVHLLLRPNNYLFLTCCLL